MSWDSRESQLDRGGVETVDDRELAALLGDVELAGRAAARRAESPRPEATNAVAASLAASTA